MRTAQDVRLRVNELIAVASDLAERRAYFSARRRFLQALTVLAQGLDSDEHSTEHRDALAAVLTAMQEANDFIELCAPWTPVGKWRSSPRRTAPRFCTTCGGH